VTASSDAALQRLLGENPAAGWRAFIDQFTPLLVAAIRRAGLVDRDEVMEVYVLLCEQLSADGCERLRSQDVTRGSLGGWLTVVARHAVVDWVRSKKGRRRLFQAVQDLPPFEQRVFELYYWEERTPSEIAEVCAADTGRRADLAAVFDALERVQTTLTDRHRAELLALTVRSKAPAPLDDTDVAERSVDPQQAPDATIHATELRARLESALARLAPEDAAIVRLKYVEGLTAGAIERALGVTGVGPRRLHDILARLRAALEELGVDAADVSFSRRSPADRIAP
jgi:DNA-directed RNA polymerase specialized sigma24 family protein